MFIPFISKKLSIYLKPFDNSLVFADGDKDGYGLAAKKEADTEKLMPSLIPEGCSDKYFTIKHPMGYLTLKEETESLLLAPKDKSALQAWKFKMTKYGAALVSRDNEALAIAINPKTNSMKLINLNAVDLPIVSQLRYSALKVSPTSGANKYTIKSLYTDKFLTTTAVSYSPYWSTIDNGFGAWEFEETDHIVVDDWLRMYFEPTSDKVGRDVEMPSDNIVQGVKEFSVKDKSGTVDIEYRFTNKNYWFTGQGWMEFNEKEDQDLINLYGKNSYINRFAYRALTPPPIINFESNGAIYDQDGNYWIAVGPNVVHPEFPINANPGVTPGFDFYGAGKMDIIVTDKCGNKYYIPAVVGGVKAHTWDNGVVQTWYPYPKGEPFFNAYNYGDYPNMAGKVVEHNALTCAEFIVSPEYGHLLNPSGSTLDKYEIDKIVFYDK